MTIVGGKKASISPFSSGLTAQRQTCTLSRPPRKPMGSTWRVCCKGVLGVKGTSQWSCNDGEPTDHAGHVLSEMGLGWRSKWMADVRDIGRRWVQDGGR